MIWYRKTFHRYGAEWAADQDRIADLQMRLAADGTETFRQVMMISLEETAELPTSEDIYLSLPDAAYARLFPGNERVGAPPATATSFLVGDQIELERLFLKNPELELLRRRAEELEFEAKQIKAPSVTAEITAELDQVYKRIAEIEDR